MSNELSISQPKGQITPLSKFEYGVRYYVKTVGEDYQVNRHTAEKLTNLLLKSSDTKFIKIDTKNGKITLNLASIMGVITDETGVQELIDQIHDTYREIACDRRLNCKQEITIAQALDTSNDEIIDYFHRILKFNKIYDGYNRPIEKADTKKFMELALVRPRTFKTTKYA